MVERLFLFGKELPALLANGTKLLLTVFSVLCSFNMGKVLKLTIELAVIALDETKYVAGNRLSLWLEGSVQ